MTAPLAAGPLLAAFRQLTEADDRVERIEIGCTALGRPVEAFTCGSDQPLLLYGFPDPGEALGAFGALRWVRSRLRSNSPGSWVVVPVVDADGQPDWDELRRPIYGPRDRPSVDLFGGDDIVLDRIAEFVRTWTPRATIALHDEWHGRAPQPVYAFTTHEDPSLSRSIRAEWMALGLEINHEWTCPLHGPGFIPKRTLEDLPERTIWAAARASGPCAAVELSHVPGHCDAHLADLQLRWACALAGEASE